MPNVPRVSLILLAYNQASMIRKAAEAALNQDHDNLQVVLSDDCSTDETYAILEEVATAYRGPHDVVLNRTERNSGLINHLQMVVEKVEGVLLIVAAGDDLSVSHRARRLTDAWNEAGRGPAVLYSDYRLMDLDGQVIAQNFAEIRRTPTTFDEACRGELHVHGATSAITTDLFYCFPAIKPDVVHEDRVLPFRALLMGGKIVYVDEVLVDYRSEGGISRLPKDAAAAKEFALKCERRGLADAKQRLADLRIKRPYDDLAEQQCLLRVQAHETAVALGQASVWNYERVLVKNLASGMAAEPAIRMYLRYRLQSLGVASLIRRLKNREY